MVTSFLLLWIIVDRKLKAGLKSQWQQLRNKTWVLLTK